MRSSSSTTARTSNSSNARAEQMFGYRREELIGEPVDILVSGHHRASRIGHRLSNSTCRRKDGTSFHVEISQNDSESGGIFHHLCHP